MSLGCYPFLPAILGAAPNWGEDAVTPYETFDLPTSSGFGSGSYVQIGVLSSGTVKILIGYASYTLGGTGDVGFSTQNLSQPVDFVQDTDAISTVEVGSGFLKIQMLL